MESKDVISTVSKLKLLYLIFLCKFLFSFFCWNRVSSHFLFSVTGDYSMGFWMLVLSGTV